MKFKIKNKIKSKITSPVYKRRSKYFTSSKFLVNFTKVLPPGEYTRWFNSLFDCIFTDWRHGKLTTTSDQTQCERVLGIDSSTAMSQGKTCYLCGYPLSINGAPIECEHILPLISGMSHLFLAIHKIKTFSDEETNALKHEYAWAHRCCNQIKESDEFIHIAGNKYAINTDVIRSYYTKVQDGISKPLYDCADIFQGRTPLPSAQKELDERLQRIVVIINKNMTKLGSNAMYAAFIKLKTLSFFTSQKIAEILSGEGGILIHTRDRDQIALSRELNARAQELIDKEEKSFKEALYAKSKGRRAILARELEEQRQLQARQEQNAGQLRNSSKVRIQVIKTLRQRMELRKRLRMLDAKELGKNAYIFKGLNEYKLKFSGGTRERREKAEESDEDPASLQSQHTYSEINDATLDEITGFDETLTFPREFLELVGVPANIIDNADTEGIPNLDVYIFYHILSSEEYNPSYDDLQTILQEQLSTISLYDELTTHPWGSVKKSLETLITSNTIEAETVPEMPQVLAKGLSKNFNGNNENGENPGGNHVSQIHSQSTNPTRTGGRRTRHRRLATHLTRRK